MEKQLNQKERQLELQSRSAREDTARMQRIREEAYQVSRMKKGKRAHLILAILGALAFTAAALFGGAPFARLHIARQTMEEGRLEEARSILEDLGSFPGAEQLLADARYAIAERTIASSQDPAALQAAAETLRSDGREGAEDLARSADFRRAELLLEIEDFEGSREALKKLPNNYPGLRDLQLETDYQEAVSNMNLRYYTLARNEFLNLGDYQDSAAQADACIYLPALALMESGEYDAAITQLERIPDYEDSAELIRKCAYLKGVVLENKEDYYGAADAYFAAGDYEDAAERATDLTYILAEDAFTAASFEKAVTLYQRIPGHLDADVKALACIYTLGRRALNDQEYNQALEQLTRLPENYEDVPDLIRRARYALGLEAQEKEEWLAAAEQFFAVSGYRDADRRLARVLTHLTEEEAASFLPQEEPSEAPAGTPEPTAAPTAEPAAPAPSDAPAETPEPAEAPAAESTAGADEEPAESGDSDSYLVRDDS